MNKSINERLNGMMHSACNIHSFIHSFKTHLSRKHILRRSRLCNDDDDDALEQRKPTILP